ncbi:hypothetical protein AMAG_13413 [Allomyces macrogynus ATCC 38327]|uniref:ATP11-domain-containing protein n=1 Tax=Allomyces macrogynus (strain ATCC 38327) TaxID=578462 RepID=A0A0L0T1Q3_ALLM3|nr:hypothetical protein AMAG_13413 [Allomyces macrogynus ATCC 38327]|eukprot:KNE68773.1 hypothetical protein AMAG_13413 [Allomyces macrogynus ATCC 38327]
MDPRRSTVPNSNLSSMLRPTSFAARTSLRTIAARSAVSLSGIGVAPPPSMMRRPYTVPSVDYDNKYADKLVKKAQAEGFKSVDEMKAAYKKRADDEVARKRAEEDAAQKVKNEKLAKTIATDTLPSHVKKLGDLVHLDKLQSESPEVIEKLWVGFHSNKDAVSAVIPREMYLQLHGRAKQYPQFVLPVFHGDGAETFLLQHSGHQTFFTSMLSYQTHGAEAPVLFTLTYYKDLMDDKGIVLVRGEVDLDKLSMDSARKLTEGMRNFYLDQEFVLVEQMYQDAKKFDFSDVMAVARARAQAQADQAKEGEGKSAASASG